MPSSKSAKKRVRQNAARRLRNRMRKSAIWTVEKKFRAKVAEGDLAGAEELLSKVTALLDKAAKRKTIHQNKASRKKSRLAAFLNTAKST